MDGLIAEHPADPYFYELKGQILFENGRIAESIGPYREAMRYRPDSALIRFGLARALIEQGEPRDLAEATALLEEVVRLEPENAGWPVAVTCSYAIDRSAGMLVWAT